MPRCLASLTAAFLLIAAAGLPVQAQAPLSPSAHVVGNGHPETCTAAALFGAIDLGGAVTFNCGAAPLDILFSVPKTITNTVSLNGGDRITLSGNNATRLFFVTGGSRLSLSHIVLSNAKVFDDGGAIANDTGGTLLIDHATLQNNKTDDAHSGGAIINLGTLTISDSTFDNNQAGNGGALFPRFAASNTTIANSLFRHNATLNTTNGWGGAILLWDGAPVAIQNSQFISNTAIWGGSMLVYSSARATVQGSQFISNTAAWGGALYVDPGGILTITNSLLTNNLADSGSTSADGGGGAIYNNGSLVLAGTTIQDNLTVVPPGFGFTGIRAGGALWNSSQGVVSMTGGALTGNRALHGGAIYSLGNITLTTASLADNLAGRGGAIENANYGGNTLTLSATAFIDNQVSFALYPAITTPLGGAIFNTAHLDVTNSTFSGNNGSVAIQEDNSVITLTNATLAHNPDGGLASDQSPNTSQVHLFNTLLTDNGADNCGPILFGTFTSQNSLSSDATCNTWAGSDNINGVDPQLSPLGYHLGLTQNFMLASGSPAKDAGVSCPPIDQRGVHRPQGPACDIGAIERRANDAFYFLLLPLTRR